MIKKDFFTVVGARTNNLKGLNVNIKLNSITAITGVSGGGKSSLAYDTLFAICRKQFNQLDLGSYEDSKYKVKKFTGAIPSISLSQNNYNSNPKSTVYSYLDVPSFLYSIIPANNNLINHSSLRLNKPGNECPHCQGNRETLSLSENLVVDCLKPLQENPFKCWSGANLSRHTALLRAFCEDQKIDLEKSISDLSLDQKNKILYETSSRKFKINFSFGGKRRSREERYIGPIKQLSDLSKSDKVSLLKNFMKFCLHAPCTHCDGTGINPDIYKNSKIASISFYDFLRHPITDVIELFDSNCGEISDAINELIQKMKTLVELGLGHISLIRQIPSLSGGELQRLRFGQVCNTSISGVMFVVDEISSQISFNNYHIIIEKMRNICSNGNTIVMIDHNNFFVQSADRIICIGPESGAGGGYIIPYLPSVDNFNKMDREFKLLDMVFLPSVTKNNVLNVAVSVPRNSVTGIFGISGSGKSSFARAVADSVSGTYYVSQKQMRGNIRSNVATALDLVSSIASIYSLNSNKNKDNFLPQSGKLGCCINCNGTGVVVFTRTFEKTIRVVCPLCEGELFSDIVDNINVCDINIKKFYGLPLRSLPKKLVEQNKKINLAINIAEALGVSHLSLNRKISSLSGGEVRRIKLLQALMSSGKDKILIIDEPGSVWIWHLP